MKNDASGSSIRAWTVNYLVPKGYDGCVYGMRNSQIEWGEGQYIFDLDNSDTLFFRFADIDDVKTTEISEVADINLSVELANKIVINFYMNMINYFNDDTIIGFFDLDEDGTINQNESKYFLAWALDKYNIEQNPVFSDEASIKAASDYLAGKLDVPDELYIPSFLQ